MLLHHQTAVTNFYDEEQIKSIYYPECERVMCQATGAVRAVAFDHIVRNAAMSAKDKTIKIPAKRVHNDYTAWSAPQRVRDLMGEEAEELLKHRFAINNLWRPIRGPVLESPLTLCDAQSLAEKNLIASDLKYPDRTGETYSITYNPSQRYYYFPKMQADEAVLIRCYDSARNGAARFSAQPASTTRPLHPTRSRARASKSACWCSSRPAPSQSVASVRRTRPPPLSRRWGHGVRSPGDGVSVLTYGNPNPLIR